MAVAHQLLVRCIELISEPIIKWIWHQCDLLPCPQSPCTFVQLCRARAALAEWLQQCPGPGCCRREAEQRWRPGWIEWAPTSCSWHSLRNRRRTDTRTADWRTSVDRHRIQCRLDLQDRRNGCSTKMRKLYLYLVFSLSFINVNHSR